MMAYLYIVLDGRVPQVQMQKRSKRSFSEIKSSRIKFVWGPSDIRWWADFLCKCKRSQWNKLMEQDSPPASLQEAYCLRLRELFEILMILCSFCQNMGFLSFIMIISKSLPPIVKVSSKSIKN